ncbi:hypothetical protein EBU95_03960 [bacterium]|nr:hypothetical protein [bacterium]
MGYNNREIEVKMLVKGCKSLKRVEKLCLGLFKPINVITDQRTDYYWAAPATDFVRVRQMEKNKNGHGQMTVKKTDRGSNFDRLEIDLDIFNVNQAVRLKTAEYGKKPKKLKKKYTILFLDRLDTNISVYQIDKDKRIFVEVESRNARKVNKLVKILQNRLPFPLEVIRKSLYDIFILRKGIK